METIALLAVIGAAGVKINDFVRYLKAWDRNGMLGTLLGWGAGVALLFLVSAALSGRQTRWAPVDGLGSVTDWNTPLKILVGAGIMSLAMLVGVDGRKALDNTTSSAVPKLIDDVDV